MDVVEERMVRRGVICRGFDGDAFRCVRATMRSSGGKFDGGFDSIRQFDSTTANPTTWNSTVRSNGVIESGSTAIALKLGEIVLVHYTTTSDAFERRLTVSNGGRCVGRFDSIRLFFYDGESDNLEFDDAIQ